VADLSQHKTLIAPKSRRLFPSWAGIPVRVFLLTLVGALLCFAVSLLLAIVGTITVAWVRGVHPDLRIAYREVALPIAVVAAAVILVAAVITEVRNYRQRQTLRTIERIS
jgi:TRAP-type C4-dicarboxylate transport system permease small subunit